METARWWMLAAAAVLFVAAALHWGAFGHSYAHERARIPETIIGLVLVAGALLMEVPGWGPVVGLGALIFGVLGVLLGIFLVVIGVGPHTRLDIALHAVMLALLVGGLISAWTPEASPQQTTAASQPAAAIRAG